MDIKDKKLGLFFTRGMSLEKWEKLGMLNREILTYQELAKHFGQIYFFTYGSNDAKYSNILAANIKIVGRPKFLPYNFYSLILPLIRLFYLKKIDILKTNQMDGSWAAVFAKKIFGKKLVVRCGYEWLFYLESAKSSFLKKHLAYFIEKFAYGNSDKIIITSLDDKDFIVKKFHVDEKKIEVIPNYVDTNKFTPAVIGPEPSRIVFVGRLEEVKNLFNLISAMSGLNADLAIIGAGSQRKMLEEWAKKAGAENVSFLGIVDQNELPNELCKSKIFILPSLSEGNPKVLLEAMSCGLPCVGTNVKGINSIINNDENGIICETDPESIHSALAKLLADSDLREKIGNNARKLIVENFSLEKILEKEINLYKSLLIAK